MRREPVGGKAAAIVPDPTLPVALGAFFLFGLPDGLLGVAWPSMRADFQVGLAALGVPLLVLNGCYILTAPLSGVLTNRLGAGRALAGALTLYLVGLMGVALAPKWFVLILAMGLLGLCLGVLDSGLNAYAALRHGSGVMNLLHGLYGVGTFAGPLAATASLLSGWGWRPAYWGLAVVGLVVVIGIIVTRRSWSERPATRASAPKGSLWNRALLFSLVSFVCMVGLEAGLGKWAFSVLIGSRHFSAGTAGILVSLYWGGFTAGRMLAAATARFSSPGRLLIGSLTTSLLGIILFWWNPVPAPGCSRSTADWLRLGCAVSSTHGADAAAHGLGQACRRPSDSSRRSWCGRGPGAAGRALGRSGLGKSRTRTAADRAGADRQPVPGGTGPSSDPLSLVVNHSGGRGLQLVACSKA